MERGWKVLATTSLGSVMVFIDTSILNVAFLDLVKDYGVDKQRQLTDLISLVRFASGMDGDSAELRPFADEVDKRFADWVFRHNGQRATAFTPEQMDWLRLMKDHIAASCVIRRAHFSLGDFAAQGGLQKAWSVFDAQLDPLMDEMNLELVA